MGVGASAEVKPIVSYEEAQERVPAEWLETIQLMFQEMTHHADLKGRITKKKFEQFYGAKAVRMLGPLFDRLFAVLDLDGDGTVSYEEFLSGICIFGKGTREEKLKLLFKVYDLNGDGFISKDEFSQMLKGSVFSSQAAVGALLMTDEKEFHDLMADVKSNAKDSGPRLEAVVDNIFKECDLNNDGMLSFVEFSLWAAKSLNFNQWVEQFLPDKLDKELKSLDPSVLSDEVKVEESKELFPLEKEPETLAVTATALNRATSRFVSINSDGCTIAYTGKGVDLRATGGHQCGVIHPVHFVEIGKSPFFYFEVTVLKEGNTNENAIGFYPTDTLIRGVPGWYNNSYGFHADEGTRYNLLKPLPFVEEDQEVVKKWGTGDVVGAGITGTTIFFTLNGKLLQPFFEHVQGAFYPLVGLTSPGAVVRLNFGEAPFKWKGEEDIIGADMDSPSSVGKRKAAPDLKVSTATVSIPFSPFHK